MRYGQPMSWCDERKGLYAIIDPDHCHADDPVSIGASIAAAGCAVIQLRAKAMSDRALLELAAELRRVTSEHNVPFVVNDRPDIAKLVNADGVHLGQDDLSVADARAVVGRMCVGVSTHNPAQARAAQAEGADLIGFGPVFDTASKDNPDQTTGLVQLAGVVSEATVPVVAIGGINADRVGAVRETGVRFVAVISALCGAPDPAVAAAALHF